MERINKVIERLSFEELREFHDHLEPGEVKNLVVNKLERFKNSNKVCPVCNAPIGDDGFILVFGPSGFKKKATFDGVDCLEYFLYNMRK